MVADTAGIALGHHPVCNESVAQIGHKFICVEKKEIKKQTIQIEQVSQSGMGTMKPVNDRH